MMIFWKNKGILVLIITIFTLLFTAIIFGILNRNFDYIANLELDYTIILGLGLIISGFLIKFFSNDFYINEQGEKVKYNIESSFFFLDNKYWYFVEITIGTILVLEYLIDLI